MSKIHNIVKASRENVEEKATRSEREILNSLESIFWMLVEKEIKSITFDDYHVIEKVRDEITETIWMRHNNEERSLLKKLADQSEDPEHPYKTEFQRSGKMCITWFV